MAGFFFANYVVFGFHASAYSKLGSSMITTFQQFFDKSNYDTISDISEAMAIVLTILFAIICFLIILNLFTAVVMSNYATLKFAAQLRTEAKTRITRKRGLDFIKRLVNLVTCAGYSEEPSEDVEEGRENAQGKKSHRGMSIWKVCLKNANELCRYKMDTAEEAEQREEEMIELIRREKAEEKMTRRNVLEKNIIHKITDGVIYIVFLALFITLIMLQINIDSLCTANEAMMVTLNTHYSDSKEFPFEQLGSELRSVISHIYEKRDEAHNKLGPHILVYSDPFVILTYQRYNLVKHSIDKTTAQITSEFVLDDKYKWTRNKSDATFGGRKWEYRPVGDKRTFNGEGGVVVYLPGKLSEANSIVNSLLTESVDKTLRLIALEVFAYMPNSEIFTRSAITFKFHPTGLVKLGLNNIAFLIDHYSTRSDKARIALELIVCLFVLYFTVKELMLYAKMFMKVYNEDRAMFPKPGHRDTTATRILLFLYVDPTQVKEGKCSEYITLFIWGTLKFVFYSVKQVLVGLFMYVFNGFFHLFSISSVVLYYFLIYYW